jgi:hypothetical protein
MLNILSLIFGLVAALLVIPGLIPFLGWMNWMMLPVAGIGLALGLLSSGTAGRNLCLIVLLIGCVRLWLGGGII